MNSGSSKSPIAIAGLSAVHAQTPVYLLQWGTWGYGNGQFFTPFGIAAGVAVDPAGDIFVTEAGSHRVQKFGVPPTPVQGTSWGRLKSLHH